MGNNNGKIINKSSQRGKIVSISDLSSNEESAEVIAYCNPGDTILLDYMTNELVFPLGPMRYVAIINKCGKNPRYESGFEISYTSDMQCLTLRDNSRTRTRVINRINENVEVYGEYRYYNHIIGAGRNDFVEDDVTISSSEANVNIHQDTVDGVYTLGLTKMTVRKMVSVDIRDFGSFHYTDVIFQYIDDNESNFGNVLTHDFECLSVG